MTELAIVGGLNALCFWKRPVYVMVPVAMLDVIYGLIWATSKNTTPIYNSTAFYEGLVIALMGIGIFVYEFIWLEIFKKGKGR